MIGWLIIGYVLGAVITAPFVWRQLMTESRSLSDEYAASQMVVGAAVFWPVTVVVLIVTRGDGGD